MATATISSALPYIDPADMPDLYAVSAHGRCMEPVYTSGVLLVGDKRQTPEGGDVVILHFRRDIAPHYGASGWIKRLVQVSPDGAMITVEQLNPHRRYSVPANHIVGMHKCIGTAISEGKGIAAFRPQHEEAGA